MLLIALQAQPMEIVVQAARDRCLVRIADRQMSANELGRAAAGWPADRPVRVLEPRGANLRCRARIMFKLGEKGIRLVEFVYQDGPAADRASDHP